MSTSDVPGARSANADTLAMGCWAEHDDGSLIFVESVESGSVVYSIFDLEPEPVVEYRDAMPEAGFKRRFSFPNKDGLHWTWHDKTPFPWERVMQNFRPGTRHASAEATMTAAQRVAESLALRAERVRERTVATPAGQAVGMMQRIHNAIDALRH